MGETALAKGIRLGSGTALMVMPTAGDPMPAGVKVKVAAGHADHISSQMPQSLFRFQLVRPDSKGIAFAVFTLPQGASLGGEWTHESLGVKLLYYEQRPGGGGDKLFLAKDWEGEFRVLPVAYVLDDPIVVKFSFSVVAEKGQGGAGQEDFRQILDGMVVFPAAQTPGIVEYYDSGDTLYTQQDVLVVYDDGCSSRSDYDDYGDYDDDDYYDDSDDWSSYSDSGDGSCDGDTYDDGDSYDSGSQSCDYDGDTSDDDDDSDYYDDSGSGYDDSSDDSSDDWDWEGDDYDDGDDDDSAWLVTSMSWTGPLVHAGRSAWPAVRRLLPLLLGLCVVGGLRLTSRRISADSTGASS